MGKESYLYDGNGRRVRTLNAVTGTIEYFGYGKDGRLLQDWSNRRAVRNGYIYLGNSLVATYGVTISGPSQGAINVQYKHTDALGSPVATTDANKAVLSRTSYTPYGVPTLPVDGVGYTGHFIDVNTSLTYMQQRYYDPQIGRFLSVDPVATNPKSGDNFSRYWYANNNPYKFTDPDGREGACMYGPSMCGMRETSPEEKARQEEVTDSLAGFIPGVELARCATSGCGAGGWAMAGLGLVPGEGKLGQFGLRSLSWIGGAGRGVISFGKNANQISHAFRHAVDAGLSVRDVATRVSRDVNKIAESLEVGKTINRTVTVNGTTLQYAVHKLEDGTLRVGRIKVITEQ